MKPRPSIPLFQIGESVTWTSTSNGVAKVKSGKIDQVVPVGWVPNLKFRFRPQGRNHTSFVVKTATGKLYWPIVKNLVSAVGKTPKRNTWLGPAEERFSPEKIVIDTKCPAKWAFVDMETGDIWVKREGTFRAVNPAELQKIKQKIQRLK